MIVGLRIKAGSPKINHETTAVRRIADATMIKPSNDCQILAQAAAVFWVPPWM